MRMLWVFFMRLVITIATFKVDTVLCGRIAMRPHNPMAAIPTTIVTVIFTNILGRLRHHAKYHSKA